MPSQNAATKMTVEKRPRMDWANQAAASSGGATASTIKSVRSRNCMAGFYRLGSRESARVGTRDGTVRLAEPDFARNDERLLLDGALSA